MICNITTANKHVGVRIECTAVFHVDIIRGFQRFEPLNYTNNKHNTGLYTIYKHLLFKIFEARIILNLFWKTKNINPPFSIGI